MDFSKIKISKREFLRTGACALAAMSVSLYSSDSNSSPHDTALKYDKTSFLPEIEPSFITNQSLDRSQRKELKKALEGISSNFDDKPGLSLDSISSNIAWLNCPTSVIGTGTNKIVNGGTSQALIMPYKKGLQLFLTAYHCVDDGCNDGKFHMRDGSTMKMAEIITYSPRNNLDLCMGYCYGTSENLSQICFINKCNKGDIVLVVPSGSRRNEQETILIGEIIGQNKYLMHATNPVQSGYSGSPIILKGKIAGITTRRYRQPESNHMIATKSTGIEALIKNFEESE